MRVDLKPHFLTSGVLVFLLFCLSGMGLLTTVQGPNSVHCVFLKIKLYRNIANISLCAIWGCFHGTMAELSVFRRDWKV